MDKIRIPTLLTQGTVDTLFTLREAETNYRILHGNKVPVKMMWHCGGHGTCDFPAGAPGRVENAALKWFDRYLNGNTKVDTGAAFEWVDDKGTWHTSAGYPLKPRAALSGTGSGTLPLSPGLNTGSPTDAMSGSPNVEVAIPAPKGSESLVGAPELTLAYNGTASQADTRVYAQVVDKTNGQALGNQVTPIPVILDGTNRTVTRPLESIAAQAGPGSRLAVQIVPASLVYGTQRATGAVTFSSAKATLPAGEPVKATTTKLAFRKVARTRASSVRRHKRTMRFGLCATRRQGALDLGRGQARQARDGQVAPLQRGQLPQAEGAQVQGCAQGHVHRGRGGQGRRGAQGAHHQEVPLALRAAVPTMAAVPRRPILLLAVLAPALTLALADLALAQAGGGSSSFGGGGAVAGEEAAGSAAARARAAPARAAASWRCCSSSACSW